MTTADLQPLPGCPCGRDTPSRIFTTWVCVCGRKYEPPTADMTRLLARIDELERRVEVLEAKIDEHQL